jgi:hypothetical protein
MTEKEFDSSIPPKQEREQNILNLGQKEMIDNMTLIIPDNDGEAHMAIEIAKKLGMDVRISSQAWGARLDREIDNNPNILVNSKTTILLFEMPSKEIEEKMRKTGVSIEIIDHHQYRDDDRSKEASSLEQFLERLNLSDEQLKKLGFNIRFIMGISINDKAYIFGLREAGYSDDEIIKIREYDIKTQLKEKYEEALKRNEEIYANRILEGNVVILETIDGDSSTIVGDKITLDNPDKVPQLLDLRRNKEGKISFIYFSGPTEIAKILKGKGNPTFGGSGKTEKLSDFVGWVNPTQEQIEEIKKVLKIMDYHI